MRTLRQRETCPNQPGNYRSEARYCAKPSCPIPTAAHWAMPNYFLDLTNAAFAANNSRRLRRSAPAMTCVSPCYQRRRLAGFMSFRCEPCGYVHSAATNRVARRLVGRPKSLNPKTLGFIVSIVLRDYVRDSAAKRATHYNRSAGLLTPSAPRLRT